jgi:hypothetical protein
MFTKYKSVLINRTSFGPLSPLLAHSLKSFSFSFLSRTDRLPQTAFLSCEAQSAQRQPNRSHRLPPRYEFHQRNRIYPQAKNLNRIQVESSSSSSKSVRDRLLHAYIISPPLNPLINRSPRSSNFEEKLAETLGLAPLAVTPS